MDNWKDRYANMKCFSCMFYVVKVNDEGKNTDIGRCRRHAPTLSGWPVMFFSDWCGDHKLNENRV